MTKWLALTVAALLAVVDQIIKIWALNVLKPVYKIVVIEGFFNLTFVENRGAAFGIMQGKTVFLSVVVALVLAAGIYMIISRRIDDKFLIWVVSLIISGGAGNLIDRVRLGYVVDYLDFSALFGFPVFNFADCCVVIGTALLVAYVIKHDVNRIRSEKAGEANGAD